jgi:hypothetical protein
MQKDIDIVVNRKRKHSIQVKWEETFKRFLSGVVTLSDF